MYIYNNSGFTIKQKACLHAQETKITFRFCNNKHAPMQPPPKNWQQKTSKKNVN